MDILVIWARWFGKIHHQSGQKENFPGLWVPAARHTSAVIQRAENPFSHHGGKQDQTGGLVPCFTLHLVSGAIQKSPPSHSREFSGILTLQELNTHREVKEKAGGGRDGLGDLDSYSGSTPASHVTQTSGYIFKHISFVIYKMGIITPPFWTSPECSTRHRL